MNKKNIITLGIIFILTLLIFHNFITMHYATDTYNIINRGYEEYAIKYSLNDGRPVMCLISLFANSLNVSIQTYIISLTIIALFVSCISVIMIKNIVMKNMEKNNLLNEILILIATYVTIFNFSYLENLQFAECAVMSVSILLYIISANMIVNKVNKYYIKSLILVILAVLCYQGTISFLIVFTFLLSLLKEKVINKQVIKNVILTGIWLVIGIGINLVQIRISGYFIGMTQTRMGSISNIINNSKYIYENIVAILKKTYYLFPKNIMIFYIGVLIFCNTITIRNNKDIWKMMHVISIILISIITTFIPNLLTLAAFGTGRMSFSIGAMIGLTFIYLLIDKNENKKINYVIYIALITYVILTITNYMYIMYQHKQVNIQDREECEIIGNWIKEYEEENEITINNIVFLYDNNSSIYYNNIENKSALCYRALYPEWSRIGAINYYNNMDLKEIEETKGKYYSNTSDKDYDMLDKEQLNFVEDTVYLTVY